MHPITITHLHTSYNTSISLPSFSLPPPSLSHSNAGLDSAADVSSTQLESRLPPTTVTALHTDCQGLERMYNYDGVPVGMGSGGSTVSTHYHHHTSKLQSDVFGIVG